MKRALLISIHPEWAEKILNGEKTIEIRTWIPKDYAGWVYVAITQGKPYITQQSKTQFTMRDNKNFTNILNGKVAFRFWYEKVDTIEIGDDGCVCLINGVQDDFPKGSCLTEEELCDYIGYGDDLSISSNFAKGYAWHIDKLEIFDKPKELSEFWLDPIDFSIHTIAEALAEGYKPIQRAPQKCAWVYGGEQS